MRTKIIYDSISRNEALEIGKEFYDDILKGVVDIKLKIIAIGGEMHVDAEEELLKNGSNQSDLWGFNILMDKDKKKCLVYESFINIRPRDNNKNLKVQDPKIRKEMKKIIFERIIFD